MVQHRISGVPTWLDTVTAVAVAAAVAAPGLGLPPFLVFDELYYVSDAVSFLDDGVARSFTAHPPLGTWFIAAGIAGAGPTPVGWRLAPLLFGLLCIAVVHQLSLRFFGDGGRGRVAAMAAALLVAADGSWLVLTRTAMLDGPLTTLLLCASAAAVIAIVGQDEARTGWLIVSGASLGAALAVKWSAAAGILVVGIVLTTSSRRRALRAALVVAATAALVYALAWVPFAANRDEVPIASCPGPALPCPESGGLGGVMQQHAMLVRYHGGIRADATEASPPWSWPLLTTPISFYRPGCHTVATPVADPIGVGQDCPPVMPGDDTIVYAGNPVLWFGFLALVPALASLARTRPRGSVDAAMFAYAGWTTLWLPWFVVTRTSYLWYLAPVVPYLAIGTVATILGLQRVRVIPAYLAAAVGAAVLGTVSLLPLVPAGGAVAGWALGGLAVRPAQEHEDDEGLPGLTTATLTLLVGAAGIAGLVLHSTWTVTS